MSARADKAYAAGRSAVPAATLPREGFQAWLAARDITPEALEVYGADLFVAAACNAGDRGALAHFEATLLAQVPRWLGRLRLAPADQDELLQALRLKMLVGPTARIGSYRGQGPLPAWVRVSAVRMALDFKQSSEDPGDAHALDVLIAAGADPELAAARQQHGGMLREALKEALDLLSAREKTLLRMHFLDGMTVDQIGLAYRVHRATAARWIVAIRAQVLEQVAQKLKIDLRARSSELRSLYRLVRSDVDVSIHRILGEKR